MKTSFKYMLALAVGALSAVACDDYLDKEVDLSLSNEQIFSKYENTRGFLANIYTYLPDAFSGFGAGDGGQFQAASHDCMTDNSSSYWPVHYYHAIQSDTYDAKNHFYADLYWSQDLRGIRACNQFLANARESVVGNAEKAGDDNRLYDRWRAEARLIRALLVFDMIGYFGDVPLVGDNVFDPGNQAAMNIARTPAAEALQYVANECDSVKDILPFRYANENENWGRVNGAAAYALKSRALLYKASPLNNPSGNTAWWAAAATAAQEFLAKNDAQSNKYALFTTGNPESDYYTCFITTPHLNNEYILSRSEWNQYDLERYLAPCGFSGIAISVGRTNPTLNFVSAYEMASGLPYDNAASGYDEAHPYANRDPRFEQTIFHQGTIWGDPNQDEERPVDLSPSGIDYQGTHGGTYTGFYCKKFCVNISWKQPSSTPRACPIFRYAEVLLNAAEAVNEAEGPAAAYQYVDQVRQRVGMPSWRDAYDHALTQAEFRERIRNERRIELAFEDHRFFDERRWKLFEGVTPAGEQNKPYYQQVMNLWGHEVTLDASAPEGYTVSVIRHALHPTRVFNVPKNYYFPIPYDESKAAPALGQNKGWEM